MLFFRLFALTGGQFFNFSDNGSVKVFEISKVESKSWSTIYLLLGSGGKLLNIIFGEMYQFNNVSSMP